MNEPKFTKGQWKVTGDGNRPDWVQTMNNDPIANFNFVGKGNNQENAKLIASAPKRIGLC